MLFMSDKMKDIENLQVALQAEFLPTRLLPYNATSIGLLSSRSYRSKFLSIHSICPNADLHAVSGLEFRLDSVTQRMQFVIDR